MLKNVKKSLKFYPRLQILDCTYKLKSFPNSSHNGLVIILYCKMLKESIYILAKKLYDFVFFRYVFSKFILHLYDFKHTVKLADWDQRFPSSYWCKLEFLPVRVTNVMYVASKMYTNCKNCLSQSAALTYFICKFITKL